MGDELTSGKPDVKEGLYFGQELSEDDPRVLLGLPLHGPNLFPEGDLNSDAEAGPGDPSWTPTYDELIAEGFVDTWDQGHPRSYRLFPACQNHLSLGRERV